MNFSTRGEDGLAHGLDDFGQAVGSDMGVGVNEDFVLRAVLVEYSKHFIDRAALFAAGVQFSVGIGSRSAFAEAIVGIGVNDALPVYRHHVAASAVDILAALEPNGFESRLDQLQCREESGRTCTDNNDLSGRRNVGVFNGCGAQCCSSVFRVDMQAHAEVNHHFALAGVDGAAQDVDAFDAVDVKSGFGGCGYAEQGVFRGGARVHAQFYCFKHWSRVSELS